MISLNKTRFVTLIVSVSTAVTTAIAATPPDTIRTVAGGGPDHAPPLAANVDYPVNTAVDSARNFY